MYFIYVLVIAVAILTILAALALVLGSSKQEKTRSLWFLVAAVGEVIWAVSITVFLSLGNGEADEAVAPWLVKGIYSGALLMDAALLFYVSWKYKYGGGCSVAFLLVAVILVSFLFYDPNLLYSEIVLKESGNSILIDMSKGYYFIYCAFFGLLNLVLFLFLGYRIRHTSNKKSKRGYLFFLIGLLATGLMGGIFDLLLPPFRYDLIWVGPMAIGLTILGFYFAILKYKMISLNAGWLKVLSSVVIISSAFIAYLLIFHLVFSALFKVANPSFQVILLNFIMIAIVLALVPAFTEIMDLTKSLIMTKQINLPYIVKKLSTINHRRLNYKEISGFLAEYMHFSYVGFIVKGKFYVADDCKISSDGAMKIAELPIPLHGVWQDMRKLDGLDAKEVGLSRVAVITGARGEVMGQMVFGKPVSKVNLEHKDLAEIVMIISLMGTIIEDGGSNKS